MRCLKRYKAVARYTKSRRFESVAQRSVKICTLSPNSAPDGKGAGAEAKYFKSLSPSPFLTATSSSLGNS